MTYPIFKGTKINVAAFISLSAHEGAAVDGGPWVSAASMDDVVGAFKGWDPKVQTLLEVCVFRKSGRLILTNSGVIVYRSTDAMPVHSQVPLSPHFCSGPGCPDQ